MFELHESSLGTIVDCVVDFFLLGLGLGNLNEVLFLLLLSVLIFETESFLFCDSIFKELDHSLLLVGKLSRDKHADSDTDGIDEDCE